MIGTMGWIWTAGLLLGGTPEVTETAAVPWGATGHRIVAEIAERHLSPAARGRARDLLGGAPLARVASWADDFRGLPEGRHTATWHYTTLPTGDTWILTPGDDNTDIGEAMVEQEAILSDPGRTRAERADALRFLVHFVGDVHQPMHVGRPGDRGGNDIPVRWFGQDTNLHSVWDTRIIEHHMLSYTEWVDFIDYASPQEIADWQDDDMAVWMAESQELREIAYEALGDSGMPSLSWDYRNSMTPHVEARLLRAGIRLAAVLERALTP